MNNQETPDSWEQSFEQAWESADRGEIMMYGEENDKYWFKLGWEEAIKLYIEPMTSKSWYEGATKKECVDLCIRWAKKIIIPNKE